MTKRQSIADRMRSKGFPPLSEDQYQDNIRELVPTVCFCEETAMTTDLSSKSVEELAAYFGQIYDQACNSIVAFDELARRLKKEEQLNEELQQKLGVKTCGCSYDAPGVFCMHHSHALMEARRLLEAAQQQILAQLTKIKELQRQIDVQLETNIKLLEWRDKSYKERIAHDAKIVAEAKAEALEEAARIVETGPFAGTRHEDALAIRSKADEYRAKAGRKE